MSRVDGSEVKIVVVGTGGVGKSATVIQFVQNHFLDEYDPSVSQPESRIFSFFTALLFNIPFPTPDRVRIPSFHALSLLHGYSETTLSVPHCTIEDSYRKQLLIDGHGGVLLDILDTAGMEEYSAMRDSYMRAGQSFVFTYSITSRSSFEELTVLKDQIQRVKDMDIQDIPVVIQGNKIDLEKDRQVTTTEGSELAASWGAMFYETSAKTRVNIDELFMDIARDTLKRVKPSGNARGARGGRKHRVGGCILS